MPTFAGELINAAVNVKVTVALLAVLVKVPSELNESGVAVTSLAGLPSSSVKTALVGVLLYAALNVGVMLESPTSSSDATRAEKDVMSNAGTAQSSIIVPIRFGSAAMTPDICSCTQISTVTVVGSATIPPVIIPLILISSSTVFPIWPRLFG